MKTQDIDLTDPSIIAEADELEQVIPVLDTLYDAGEKCIHPITKKLVPDPMYDEMRKRLRLIRPTSKALKDNTASDYQPEGRKVKHDPPMASIDKANGSLVDKDATRLKWLREIWSELKYPGSPTDEAEVAKHICQSYKLDGLAVSIIYKGGKLWKAGLRPRGGIEGEDVTANVIHVKNVPETLPMPIDIIIRGELYCLFDVFERKNKELVANGERDEPFANERQYATGSIRQHKDPTKTKARELSFRAYSLLGFKDADKYYKDELQRAMFCAKVLGIEHVRIHPHKYESLKEMEDVAKNINYRTDGVVLSVNNLEDQQQMGLSGSGPDATPVGKLAWKFEEEHAACPIKQIDWGTGRTRKITPVANFDAVTLADTQVKHVTLHNLGYMRRNKIGLGTVIAVIKSGNIIPYVQDVISNLCDKPEYPKNCPACGGQTHVEDNGIAWTDKDYMAELICTNVMCGSSAVATLVHFLTVIGVKGIGESAVQCLYDAKKVVTWSDFYKLDFGDLFTARFSFREAHLAMVRLRLFDQPEQQDTIDLANWIANYKTKGMTIKLPLWQIFASLGISGAGKSVGRAFEAKFKTMPAIMSASVDDMVAVEGVGKITAETVFDFFKDNRSQVEELLKYVEPLPPNAGGKLTGMTFCFSGGFDEGKEFWERAVSNEGANVVGSVSKKVTHFVAGPGSGSKSQKAKDLGIAILDVEAVKKLL